MQITSRFTIAVHIITCIDYFQNERKVTSSFLASSVGANPVIIRNVISQLKAAGIVLTSQGSSGAKLARPLRKITFYDVYKAVDCIDETGLFHFHEKPNMDCPVGRNIHGIMDNRLQNVQSVMENEMKRYTMEALCRDMENILAKER